MSNEQSYTIERASARGIGPFFSSSASLMPGLDFPFVFECSNCDEQTIVERADAQDSHPDPDFFGAIHILEQRDWLRDELDHMIWCPDCIPDGSDEQGGHGDPGQLNAFNER